MIENNNIDHESEFLQDLIDTDRFVVIVGQQNSGKSYFIVSYINMAIKYKLYDEIHFVAPTIHVERHGSYDFMKSNKIFHLYSSFNDEIIDKLKDNNRRQLLICDDATSYLIENRYNSRLVELVTCVRHYRTTLFCLIHSLSYVLFPTLRANINHLFIGNFMDDSLVEKVWRNFLSRKIRKYEDFSVPYDESQQIKQNLIYFSCNAYDGVDYNVKKWELLQFHDVVTKNGKATIHNAKSDDQKYIEKVKTDIHKKDIKEKLIPKKKLIY